MSSSPIALVTGASSGIGKATALRLAQQGYRVFGTSRKAEYSSSVTKGIELLTLDVTSDTSVTACVQTILEREGRIDVLVNNAGYALLGVTIISGGKPTLRIVRRKGYSLDIDSYETGSPDLLMIRV